MSTSPASQRCISPKGRGLPQKDSVTLSLRMYFLYFSPFLEATMDYLLLAHYHQEETYCQTTLKGLAQCNLFNYKTKLNKLSC